MKCEWIGIDVSIDVSIELQLEKNDCRLAITFVGFRLIYILLICIIDLIHSYRVQISTVICRRLPNWYQICRCFIFLYAPRSQCSSSAVSGTTRSRTISPPLSKAEISSINSARCDVSAIVSVTGDHQIEIIQVGDGISVRSWSFRCVESELAD